MVHEQHRSFSRNNPLAWHINTGLMILGCRVCYAQQHSSNMLTGLTEPAVQKVWGYIVWI